MREWSPYGEIVTKHLHGYFISREGQLQLTRLANNIRWSKEPLGISTVSGQRSIGAGGQMRLSIASICAC
jgi:hypothetical protein